MKRSTVLLLITVLLFAGLVSGFYIFSTRFLQDEAARADLTAENAVGESPALPEVSFSPAPSAVPSAAPDTEITPVPFPEQTPEPNNSSIVRAEYKRYLTELLENSTYPDGTVCELAGEESMDANLFAVADVDNDGCDELIIQITTTYTAAQLESVWECKIIDGAPTLQKEADFYPLVTWYDNGLALVGWSHGNGKEPEGFWPYNIYCYNSSDDLYDQLGEVFSDNIYGDCYLVRLGEEWMSYDTPAFENWYDSFMGGASELEVNYHRITSENIETLFS